VPTSKHPSKEQREQEAALPREMESTATPFNANFPKQKFSGEFAELPNRKHQRAAQGHMFGTLPPEPRVFPDGGSFRYLVQFPRLRRSLRPATQARSWPPVKQL
jgi:hypothetical protein